MLSWFAVPGRSPLNAAPGFFWQSAKPPAMYSILKARRYSGRWFPLQPNQPKTEQR